MHKIVVHPSKEHVSHINNLISAFDSARLAGAFATPYPYKALECARDGSKILALVGPILPMERRVALANDIKSLNKSSVVIEYGYQPQKRDPFLFDGHFPLVETRTQSPLIWLLSRDWTSATIEQISREVRFLTIYRKAGSSHS